MTLNSWFSGIHLKTRITGILHHACFIWYLGSNPEPCTFYASLHSAYTHTGFLWVVLTVLELTLQTSWPQTQIYMPLPVEASSLNQSQPQFWKRDLAGVVTFHPALREVEKQLGLLSSSPAKTPYITVRPFCKVLDHSDLPCKFFLWVCVPVYVCEYRLVVRL